MLRWRSDCRCEAIEFRSGADVWPCCTTQGEESRDRPQLWGRSHFDPWIPNEARYECDL